MSVTILCGKDFAEKGQQLGAGNGPVDPRCAESGMGEAGYWLFVALILILLLVRQ